MAITLTPSKRPNSDRVSIVYRGRRVAYAYTRAGRIDWLPSRCSGVTLTEEEKRRVMIEASQELARRLSESREQNQGVEGDAPDALEQQSRKLILPEGFEQDGDDRQDDTPSGEDAAAGQDRD